MKMLKLHRASTYRLIQIYFLKSIKNMQMCVANINH